MSEEKLERRSKIMTVGDAVGSFVREGCVLGVGGMHMHNNPMGVIRELVRQKKKVKTLITSPSANVNADMLVGAGLVEELIAPYMGFEHMGLSQNYRTAAEQKRIRVRESDEAFSVYSLRAGASAMPFIPYPKGLDLSDVPKLNPDDYRYTKDPFTGEEVLCIRAINPDVSFIHCQKSDVYGNAIFEGSRFTDFDMIKASDKVVLMVEEIVSDDHILKNPMKTSVPGFLVDAVVHMPYGCHPTASHMFYSYDEEHLAEYIKASKENFGAYLDRYVYGPADHDEYIGLIGGEAKLRKLVERGRVVW
jgi:glutaconate CoA-transferase subunit A